MFSFKTLRSTALALALAAFGVSSLGASATHAANFNSKEREEIGQIIRDYLVANPEVLIEAMEALEQRMQEDTMAESRAAITARHDAIYNDPNDFVYGNKNGDVTIVEFFDYACGYCKVSFQPLMDFVKQDGNIRLILKEYPILGPGSREAAKATLAAKKQGKYLDLHRALYAHRGQLTRNVVLEIAKDAGLDVKRLERDMEDNAIMTHLTRTRALGDALDVDGTPAFIVGGEMYPGGIDEERLELMVKRARGR